MADGRALICYTTTKVELLANLQNISPCETESPALILSP